MDGTLGEYQDVAHGQTGTEVLRGLAQLPVEGEDLQLAPDPGAQPGPGPVLDDLEVLSVRLPGHHQTVPWPTDRPLQGQPHHQTIVTPLSPCQGGILVS